MTIRHENYVCSLKVKVKLSTFYSKQSWISIACVHQLYIQVDFKYLFIHFSCTKVLTRWISVIQFLESLYTVDKKYIVTIMFVIIWKILKLFELFGYFLFSSMVELLDDGDSSGLSVLRTFRLLRILKLVRFLPALRRQLVVMLRTMDNVATFFALLVLFMFIFRWVLVIFSWSYCW